MDEGFGIPLIEALKLKGLFFERLQITSEYFERAPYRYSNQ